MTTKLQLIIGSTRQHRLSPVLAAWIQTQAAKQADIELEVIDLKQVNLPFFDEPTSPSMGAGTSPAAVAWAAKIAEGDASLILTPEYNAGYPAPLKNAIDYLKSEWKNRPIAIISYGYGGGLSSAAQLKQVFNRLGSTVVDSGVAIDIGAILNEVGGITDPAISLSQYEAPLAGALSQITAQVEAQAIAAV